MATKDPPPESIQSCSAEARDLLRANCTADGIMAASPTARAKARRYTRIFGRDAAICALGMVTSGDPALIDGAEASLRTLARHQADNGQIPKYVEPSSSDADFWYVGCVDATLWWLIGSAFVQARTGREPPRKAVAAAIGWLRCQEHPRLRLLQQNEASDWADIMPRSGFVLYTNALWYAVKRLYGLSGAEATKFHFNHLFYPFSRNAPDYHRLRLLTDYVRAGETDESLYLSFVNLSFWGAEGDVFGNLLSILFGLADAGPAARILDALEAAGVDAPVPARAVVSPIDENDRLWRDYMLRHRQNLPYQYHNGGCWPFIGAFWAVAAASIGRVDRAAALLRDVAAANARGGWEFNEWFHGRTGEALGMPGQSWNAAVYLLGEAAVAGDRFSDLRPG